MLAGFDELILSCRTEEARSQIGEAIRCYEGASYRAAIVMSYMAVCFDLIDKLKALDAAGDGAAKTLIGELKKYQQQLDSGNSQAIQNLLAFERNLLEKFRDDFEFFGSNEFDELARLREDRNRCAHPTFLKSEQPYIPSAELARMHIRNALVLVLSQEPRQGKAALEEIRRAILSQYFPTVINDAAERFKTLSVSTRCLWSFIVALLKETVSRRPQTSQQYSASLPWDYSARRTLLRQKCRSKMQSHTLASTHHSRLAPERTNRLRG